jgi:hypothetical protein
MIDTNNRYKQAMKDTEDRCTPGLWPRRHPTEPDESDDSIVPLTPAQFLDVAFWFARAILSQAQELVPDVADDPEPPVDDESEPIN